jgi:nitroreductase
MNNESPKPAIQPWLVRDTDYPMAGTIGDQLRFLLRYAILAPSGHNTQPWLFMITGDGIELYADRSRALPVVDPDDRELIISCGAALATLQIAMRHFGHPAALDVTGHVIPQGCSSRNSPGRACVVRSTRRSGLVSSRRARGVCGAGRTGRP